MNGRSFDACEHFDLDPDDVTELEARDGSKYLLVIPLKGEKALFLNCGEETKETMMQLFTRHHLSTEMEELNYGSDQKGDTGKAGETTG